MTQVTVGKWGNNLAVRLPADIVHASRLQDGARVDVFLSDREIVIRQLDADAEVAAWFRGKSSAEWRAEYASIAMDWGPDAGREIVPE